MEGSSLHVDVTSTLVVPHLHPEPSWSHSLGITMLGPLGPHLEKCQENSYRSFSRMSSLQ